MSLLTRSLPLSPQEAALELLRRRRARADLRAFANTIEVPGKPVSESAEEWTFRPIETTIAAHHNLMLSALQTTMMTPYGRLMLFMPPGSAKSIYASVVAPAWYMGGNPGSRIILASYGSDLAKRHGRRARQVVKQPTYTGIFSTGISAETSAADEWALTNGSEYLAGGILSGITGNRAGGLVIDDPVKGREEADSPIIRRKTLDAYQDDLLTRLIPGGWVVLVQTRWHQEDLAGSILPHDYDGRSGMIECRDGQTWMVICLPAKCERVDDPLGRGIGEYLWPEWFDRRHWEQFERVPRTWSALYQQRPAPEEGAYFKSEWIRYARGVPKPDAPGWRFYGGSDYAVTADGGDWTVHVVVGVDQDDRLTIVDLWRGQETPDVWIERWCDLVLKWKPIEWAEETGQIRGSIGPFLTKRAKERKAWTTRRSFPTRGDKAVRAQSIRGRSAMGGLHVPETAPWVSDLIQELIAFPAGRHDDQVDALGLVGQLLDVISGGKRPDGAAVVRDRYRQAERTGASSWTMA